MKKILYYSTFIPVIGFIVHLLWPIFRYEIYSVKENSFKAVGCMVVQGSSCAALINILFK